MAATVVTILVVAVGAGCGGDGSGSGGEGQGEERTIALIDLGAAPVTAATDDVIRIAGRELGWDVRYTDAQVDPQRAATAVQSAVTQGVDAIVVNSMPAELATQALTQAKQRGIPVIQVGSGEETSDLYTAQYGEDESKLAETLADYIVEQKPQAKIGELTASVLRAGDLRSQALQAAIEGTDAEVVQAVEPSLTSSNPVESTRKTVSDLLTANPEIDTIWTVFDNFLQGTVAGVRSRESDADVYTFFATEPNVELLRDESPLQAVADNLLLKTGAVAVDQLVYHFAEEREIDPQALEKDPLPYRIYSRENLPSGPIWSTDEVLEPYLDKWAEDFPGSF